MSLLFDAQVAQRNFDVQIEVEDGTHVAVLGRNGSGKSTLLSILAGVLRPDSGRAFLGDKMLFDIPKWTAPHTRGVSLLSQEPLLFPHKTVAQNTAFGPLAKHVPRGEAARLAAHWLDEVGMTEFSSRRPGELSGGQAQRVAVARALAAQPELLLLDEPMAALDVAVAPALRRVLRRVLEGQTTLIVTHDLVDAALLSDYVIVLEDGRVAERGPTDQVLYNPKTSFTAGLAGLNLVRGRFQGGAVVGPGGMTVLGMGEEPRTGDMAAAAFSPRAVSVYPAAIQGSPRNNFEVTVREIEPANGLVRIHGESSGQSLAADITVKALADLDLYPGSRVVFAVKATQVTVYAA